MSEGDVTLGDHRLCLGDCLDVLPTLPEASVDMVFADLPYAHFEAGGRLRRHTENSWDEAISLPSLWERLLRVGKPHCVYIFTASMRFAIALIQSQPQLFRYDLVWRKGKATGHLHSKSRPMRNHEHVLAFFKGKTTYFPQFQNADRPVNSRGRRHVGSRKSTSNYRAHSPLTQPSKSFFRHPYSVIDFAGTAPQRAMHPTQKPISLVTWLLRTYSTTGATILDPTAGVMTTAVAASLTGRRSISIERDPDYYAKGVARVRDEVAGLAPVVNQKPKRKPKPVPAAQGALW